MAYSDVKDFVKNNFLLWKRGIEGDLFAKSPPSFSKRGVNNLLFVTITFGKLFPARS